MKKKKYSIDESLMHFRERKLAFEKLSEALTKVKYERRNHSGKQANKSKYS